LPIAALAWSVGFQDENHLVVLQRQRLREGALLLPGKGVLQIISGMQWPVQILLIRRTLAKRAL
jgi:hypothetical protein